MTCHDSLGYTQPRKTQLKVNEGGVVDVLQADPRSFLLLCDLTLTTTVCGVDCLQGFHNSPPKTHVKILK